MGSLDERAVQRALRLSMAEGGAWACMVGLAETYFIATAVHLGASATQLGLAVALPLALGGLGPMLALGLLRRWPHRRIFSVISVALQVITLATLALLLWRDRLPVTGLIAGLCLYQITGQAAGTAWASWYGDLVPAASRGTWFSRRNRIVYLSTCAGLVAGGGFLQWVEPLGVSGSASREGFAVLFAVAAGFRILSTTLLARSPEPRYGGVSSRHHVARFVRTERGSQALRILGLGAIFHFTVYASSPYFAPFMLEELQFSYLQYMIASLCVIVSKAVFASMWGPLVDRRGAKLVYLVSMLCVALVPLPWVWSNGLAMVLFAQVLSGLSWSGYEVGYLTMLLENSTSKTRPYVFAAQSLANGMMQISGVMAAANLLLPHVEGFREVFAVSAVGRVLVAATAPFVIMGIRAHGARPGRFAFKFFGLRSHGGFSLRPVLADESGTEDAQESPPEEVDLRH